MMGLETYKAKRDFQRTPEPSGAPGKGDARRFVVQEHHASRLHFDFRLEVEGVLKSWAVPKGPSLDPGQKRLAVMTEDHPVQYLTFEGRIAEGNYGAGEMVIWDHGTFAVDGGVDPAESIRNGRFSFRLDGTKLHGGFSLVRTSRGDDQWLLIKARDEAADANWELATILPDTSEPKAPTAKKPHTKVVKNTGTKKPARTGDTGKELPVAPVEEVLAKKFKAEDALAQVGDTLVRLTNLDKKYWSDEGYTKQDLLNYYLQVSDFILPYLKDRPQILKRYPNGITGHSFFQHDVENPPEFLSTVSVKVEGETVHYALANDLASLLYLANLGNIAFSPWHSTVDAPDKPGWVVFDLDPGDVEFAVVCEVALKVKEVLAGLGFDSFPKTSGSTGLHIYVPMTGEESYEVAAEFAERVAKVVQKEHPNIATLQRSLKKREQAEVYLDHLQNAQGKTVVSPYTVRAKPKATVSAPLKWSEVESCVDPHQFTIKTMARRLKAVGDLFAPVMEDGQPLADALPELKKLSRKARTRS